jgi:hypothetical protein
MHFDTLPHDVKAHLRQKEVSIKPIGVQRGADRVSSWSLRMMVRLLAKLNASCAYSFPRSGCASGFHVTVLSAGCGFLWYGQKRSSNYTACKVLEKAQPLGASH